MSGSSKHPMRRTSMAWARVADCLLADSSLLVSYACFGIAKLHCLWVTCCWEDPALPKDRSCRPEYVGSCCMRPRRQRFAQKGSSQNLASECRWHADVAFCVKLIRRCGSIVRINPLQFAAPDPCTVSRGVFCDDSASQQRAACFPCRP